MANKKRKVASPSKGRAKKGVDEGANKSMEISDRFAQRALVAGRAGDSGAVKSPTYAAKKKTPGSSTPRARAADAAYGRNKPLAKRGK